MDYVYIGVSDLKYVRYSDYSGYLHPINFASLGELVDVQVQINTDDQIDFVTRLGCIEKTPTHFTSGTAAITIGRLSDSDATWIFTGNDDASTLHDDTVRYWRIDSDPPICGIGFIAKVAKRNYVYYMPIVFPKVRFIKNGYGLHTQEADISVQEETLDAQIFPATISYEDSSENTVYMKVWKMTGKIYNNRSDALTALQTIMTDYFIYPF